MAQFSVIVFGRKLVTLEQDVAERYAQQIREGLWQCSGTGEPWKNGKQIDGPGGHVHGYDCLDSRTDDDVKVVPDMFRTDYINIKD